MNFSQYTLEASYAAASRIAFRSRSSFYPSFWLLPVAKRRAMYAFYAFARITDDLADAKVCAGERHRWLQAWRATIENMAWLTPDGTAQDRTTPNRAGQGGTVQYGTTQNRAGQGGTLQDGTTQDGTTQSRTAQIRAGQGGAIARLSHVADANPIHPDAQAILPALRDIITQYDIDVQLLLHIIDGAISDQINTTMRSYSQLDQYCYRVASTVGLVCLRIWNYRGEQTAARAIDCGKAFQLTNILRDLREDWQRGRCYLPLDCLAEHGIDAKPPANLSASVTPPCDFRQREAWQAVVIQYCQRAESLYQSGWQANEGIHDDGKPMFAMMWHSYHDLLGRIQRQPGQVLDRRVRLSPASKIRIVAEHFVPAIAHRLAGSHRNSQPTSPHVSQSNLRHRSQRNSQS